MFYRAAGASNAEFVEQLLAHGVVKSPRVADVMRQLDRRAFGGEYFDAPTAIGHAQTISAPHMHAMCLELLESQLSRAPDARALDVGAGSGYLAAAMALLGARTIGIERIAPLVEKSIENVRRAGHGELLDSGRLTLRQGDGWRDVEGGPFDAIHVGAAAVELPPSLLAQLAPNGRLICPVGPEDGAQELILVEKGEDGELTQTTITGVRYVPLVKDDL